LFRRIKDTAGNCTSESSFRQSSGRLSYLTHTALLDAEPLAFEEHGLTKNYAESISFSPRPM
jgi:hypothetical protein